MHCLKKKNKYSVLPAFWIPLFPVPLIGRGGLRDRVKSLIKGTAHEFSLTSDISESFIPSAPTFFRSPNDYFKRDFESQIETFGKPFFEQTVYLRLDSSVCMPVSSNPFFFAAMLGGNAFLGHQVVFFPPEDRFYFLDPTVSAFRPTTAEKLQLVVKHYLCKCAHVCSHSVNVKPLMDDVCRNQVLRDVTDKAKIILEADRSFFEGADGKVRYIDGKLLNPADGPSHLQFAAEIIARQQGAWLTLSEAYSQYALYCRQKGLSNMSAPEFKSVMTVEIRQSMNVKLRHDVPGEDGKQTLGWKDLACLAAV